LPMAVSSSSRRLVLGHSAKRTALSTRRPSRSEPTKSQGFAVLHYFGREGPCEVLVRESLGPDLEVLRAACGGAFQLKTTVLIAEQLLRRLEYLHSKGVVHRNIRPESLAFGLEEKQHHLYLVELCSSRRYYLEHHIPMGQRSSLICAARYASINAHRGLEQSRRDDLEAAGNMLVFFLRGSLPWCGISRRSAKKSFQRIHEVKVSTPVDELCSWIPKEFEQYMSYCRGLGFKERPDYAMLRQLFGTLRTRLGKLVGKRIGDADMEWNDGKSLGRLVPLDHRASYPQPDDKGRSRRSFLGLQAVARPTGHEVAARRSEEVAATTSNGKTWAKGKQGDQAHHLWRRPSFVAGGA